MKKKRSSNNRSDECNKPQCSVTAHSRVRVLGLVVTQRQGIPYGSLFSDKDLVKLSERKRGTEAVDTKSLVESVGAMDLSDHDNEDGLILQASTAESDALDKNGRSSRSMLFPATTAFSSDIHFAGTGPLELTSDAWSELPKHFGSTKKHAHTRYYRKRKSTVSDAQKWLRNTTFEEYWEVGCLHYASELRALLSLVFRTQPRI